jgi:hypothetical protein
MFTRMEFVAVDKAPEQLDFGNSPALSRVLNSPNWFLCFRGVSFRFYTYDIQII